MKGGFAGAVLGYYYFICAPQGPLELNKLQAASGNRVFSGRHVRLLKNVTGRYALLGALAMVSYQLTIDILRHHDEANSRPAFFDHALGCAVVGTGAGALIFAHPFSIFCSTFFSLSLAAPTLWWLKKFAVINPVRNPNIFYENTCTAEEIERFRH